VEAQRDHQRWLEAGRPGLREADRPVSAAAGRLGPREADSPVSAAAGRLGPREADRPASAEAGRPGPREADRPVSAAAGRPGPAVCAGYSCPAQLRPAAGTECSPVVFSWTPTSGGARTAALPAEK